MLVRIAKEKSSAERAPTLTVQIATAEASMFGAGRFNTTPGFTGLRMPGTRRTRMTTSKRHKSKENE